MVETGLEGTLIFVNLQTRLLSEIVYMTNYNLTSQGAIQTVSTGATDVQPGLQTDRVDIRAAYRRNGIDLNPDLVGLIDAKEFGSNYNDQGKQLHWVLENSSLRSIVISLTHTKRTLAYWKSVDAGGTDSQISMGILSELGVAQTEKPVSVWANAKFIACYTARCVSLSFRFQREILAVKHQLRRSRMV